METRREEYDKIIENLVDQNDHLQGDTKVKTKMELVFSKPASGVRSIMPLYVIEK